MLKNDIALQSGLDCYCNNYVDCTVEMTARKGDNVSDKAAAKTQDNGEVKEIERRMLEHLQTFLFEVTTCYLVLGFVVFRFCKMPSQPDTLIPVVIPIGDIEWTYEGSDAGQELLRIPEIDVPRHFSGENTRYYVYRFRSNGQYFSSDSAGVLSRLTPSYRRLVHARDYDLIIRNENLRKTVFVEQHLKQDTDVRSQGSRASEYGELQAIMDYTRGRKETTHSVTPPTQHEEMKASISVRAVHVMLHACHLATWSCNAPFGCMHPQCTNAYLTCMCLQQQHQKETAAPEIEFIVLPPNTQAKHVTSALGTVDVQYQKNAYEEEICAILHTPPVNNNSSQPSSFQASTSTRETSSQVQGNSGVDGGGMQRSMLLCNKLRLMNSEFQVLLSTIDVFCHSPDTARNITTYMKEHAERVSHAPVGHKRQRRLQHTRKTEVIPIQLVTGNRARNNCVITASSMSSILVCNELRSVLPPVCFVDFIKKSNGCPDSVKESINCVEAREDRNIAIAKDASGAKLVTPKAKAR